MIFSFTLAHALPEAFLAFSALVLVLVGAIRGEKSGRLVLELAVAALGIAMLLTWYEVRSSAVIFDGAFIDDAFGRYMKALALLGAIVCLIMSSEFLERENIALFEFPVLVLLSTLGILMLISANGLIALYLGLELMSLALYVLAAFHRDNIRASEAGLKYFVLGALSSGMAR